MLPQSIPTGLGVVARGGSRPRLTACILPIERHDTGRTLRFGANVQCLEQGWVRIELQVAVALRIFWRLVSNEPRSGFSAKRHILELRFFML